MVALLCWALGVELAAAWGVLAFVLNFIPFIGPFVATVLPALFAIVQFQSWEAATLIFAGVSLIQLLIGSYLEPRLSGSALSISPFLVVFAVFFAALLWGISGAFMGLPRSLFSRSWSSTPLPPGSLSCCRARRHIPSASGPIVELHQRPLVADHRR